MNDSLHLVYKVLVWASVVLEEVQTAMSNSFGVPFEAEEDVKEAQEAVEKLLNNNNESLAQASSDIDYEELVMKLQAQNMPMTPEEWDNSSLD
ncbi:hypothetical protein H6F89_30585 [Cyanobacteria bacterium FACHB-63]|nr:hypothetical protein [Cyanobacteria bacterium FACHB-63]